MKMWRAHIVPLSEQALEILHKLQPLTGEGRYLFPSLRTAERPVSDVTLVAGLRRLGYGKEEMCAHGFRVMASTLLNELEYEADYIEKQLAHNPRDKVRGVITGPSICRNAGKLCRGGQLSRRTESKNIERKTKRTYQGGTVFCSAALLHGMSLTKAAPHILIAADEEAV